MGVIESLNERIAALERDVTLMREAIAAGVPHRAMTRKQAAIFLGCSPNSIGYLLQSDPGLAECAYRLGTKRWSFDPEKLAKYRAARTGT